MAQIVFKYCFLLKKYNACKYQKVIFKIKLELLNIANYLQNYLYNNYFTKNSRL